MDFHFNYNSMLKAIRILKRPEVQYIVGATEKYLPLTGGPTIPGDFVFYSSGSSYKYLQCQWVEQQSLSISHLLIQRIFFNASAQLKDVK